MADVFSKEKRSEVMRKIRSKNNSTTELKLVAFFKANRYTGWRRAYKLPGKPDFVFPKYRLAIFADGCFWHGHHCRNLKPGDNAEYWRKKIARNKARDRNVNLELIRRRWDVVRIWECEIRKKTYEPELAALIERKRFVYELRRALLNK